MGGWRCGVRVVGEWGWCGVVVCGCVVCGCVCLGCVLWPGVWVRVGVGVRGWEVSWVGAAGWLVLCLCGCVCELGWG